jgi:hypothetical protein
MEYSEEYEVWPLGPGAFLTWSRPGACIGVPLSGALFERRMFSRRLRRMIPEMR